MFLDLSAIPPCPGQITQSFERRKIFSSDFFASILLLFEKFVMVFIPGIYESPVNI